MDQNLIVVWTQGGLPRLTHVKPQGEGRALAEDNAVKAGDVVVPIGRSQHLNLYLPTMGATAHQSLIPEDSIGFGKGQ
jgi:hypothetical protein